MSKLITGKRKDLVKRFLKSVFKNHVYVSKYELTQGFKVTGDLGFLRKPVPNIEDRFLLELDLTGKTAYDIGAHIGLMTLFFSRAVGKTGQVISFEPNPETFVTLSKNITINNLANVKLLNFGLAEKRDTLSLVFGEGSGGMGTLDQATQADLPNWGLKLKTVLVEVYPLDEYISMASLPDPAFVKIDVEGYEYNVLMGMQDTIRRCKPAILVEIHGEREQRAENYGRVLKLLFSHGYKIQELISGQRIVEDNLEFALTGRHFFATSNHDGSFSGSQTSVLEPEKSEKLP